MHRRRSLRRGRHAAPRSLHTRTPELRGVIRLTVVSLLLPVSMAAAAPPAQPDTTGTAGAEAVTATDLSVRELTRRAPVASVAPVGSLTTTTAATFASRAVSDGLPAAALRAYQAAEATMRIADPSCRLPWSLLAGIGRVESDHGRRRGPGLGPMQFAPATWALVGVDGDADGVRDPRDLDDAALSAAAYLCAGPGDLGTDDGARVAVARYHHSEAYAAAVTAVAAGYERTVADMPVVSTAGVRVGVSDPGAGVPVGITDDVAARHHRRPQAGPGKRRDDQHGKPPGHHSKERHGRGAAPNGDPRPTEPPRGTRSEDTSGNGPHGPPGPHGPQQPHGNGGARGPREPPAPSPGPSSEPGGPNHHGGRPDDRPPSTTPGPPTEPREQQFTGVVEDCGVEALCLDGYTLSGPGRLTGRLTSLVGESVTVAGVVEDDTLVVSRILR